MSDILDVAVIGAGISGLSASWLLSTRHRVVLYEKGFRLGGHAHTVTAGKAGARHPMDLGFVVYNEPSYPNLTALFAHLGVETRATDMSFSVSRGDALEYAGTGIATLFAQKRNLLSPRFWSMLSQLVRLYREAPRAGDRLRGLTLGTWLDREGYGRAVQDDHLLPMAAAIWSCPEAAVRDYPAEAFVAFCENHGLFKITGRPQWRTVVGGSRSYVAALEQRFAGTIERAAGVRAIRRTGSCVEVTDARDRTRRFDQVVIATSAAEALTLLEDPEYEERTLLAAFGRTRNLAVLHTDSRLMPRRRAVWSSWNSRMRDGADAAAPPEVTYWINRLQGIGGDTDYFLTLNPGVAPMQSSVLLAESFEHPVFDLAALEAQRRIWQIQGRDRVWFCGAWLGAGFHEDGLQSGLAVAESLGGVRRPWRVPNESARLHLPAVARIAA